MITSTAEPYSCKSPNDSYISLALSAPVVLIGQRDDKYVMQVYKNTGDFFTSPLRSKEVFLFVLQDNGERRVMDRKGVDRLQLIRAVKVSCNGTTTIQAILHGPE